MIRLEDAIQIIDSEIMLKKGDAFKDLSIEEVVDLALTIGVDLNSFCDKDIIIRELLKHYDQGGFALKVQTAKVLKEFTQEELLKRDPLDLAIMVNNLKGINTDSMSKSSREFFVRKTLVDCINELTNTLIDEIKQSNGIIKPIHFLQ